jgi:hypothetical protein
VKPIACLRPEQVRRYLGAALPPDDAGPLEEHLADCPSCAERLRECLEADPLLRVMRQSGEFESSCLSPTTVATDAATSAPGAGGGARTELSRLLHPPLGADEIGRLGGYRVLEVLGAGGMGVVCRAEDVLLGRAVALKLMRPDLPAEAEYGRRFVREGRALASLSHPHVVTIFQMGEDRGVPFLAMEYLRGQSLHQRMANHPSRPLGEVLRIAREMAAGLAYAHEQGVVHRDVKPANVFLAGEARQVKLLDFGLAHERGGAGLTRPGQMMGTPEYLAPEQAQGRPVDQRADLYSLGGVLYHLLTGALPFGGGDVLRVLAAMASSEAVPVQRFHPWLPARLATLVRRLLAKKAGERPASAAEVVAELEAIESEVAKAGWSERLVGEAVREPARQTKAVGGRPRWVLPLAVGVMALTVLFGALIAVALLPSRRRDPVVEDKGKDKLAVKDKDRAEKDEDRPAEKDKGRPAEVYQGEWKLAKATRRKAGEKLGHGVMTLEPAKLKGLDGTWTLEAKRHRHQVAAVAYSADGNLLAVSSWDGAIRCYDTTTWELVHVLIGEGVAGDLVWAPDNERLFTSLRTVMDAWAVPDGKRLGRLTGVDNHVRAALSPDGKTLAGCFAEGALLYDLSTGKTRLKLKRVSCVTWHPSGKAVAVAQDNSVRWYDVLLGKETRARTFTGQPGGLRYSRDGNWLSLGGSGSVHLWAEAEGEKDVSRPSSSGYYHWLPDGTGIVHGVSTIGVEVWYWKEGKDKAVWMGKGGFSAFTLSPDGKHVAVAAKGDGDVTIVGLDGKPIHTIECLPYSKIIHNAAGHYKVPKALEGEMIYVAETAEGQRWFTPAAFEKKYGWKNKPDEVR